MTDIQRFFAPGPWVTRDLKECVLASDYDALAAERDALLRMLAEWCVAVDNDSSWDGWDHHYKDARYRPGPMREALDAAIQEVIDEQARYDAALAERQP